MERISSSAGGERLPGDDPAAVAAQIPHGLFILTAAYDDASAGMLVQWVQRCSDDPAVVMVSLRRGQPIEPLIRDSRAFALNQISEDDRFLQRRFGGRSDRGEDVLVTLGTRCAPSGSPVLEHAMSYMDCVLLRNVDLDNDYRLYIGQVQHAEILTPRSPAVYYGKSNGK